MSGHMASQDIQRYNAWTSQGQLLIFSKQFWIAAEVSFLSDPPPPPQKKWMQLQHGTVPAGIINAEHISNLL